jgi:hypothetical protein
MTNEVPKNVLLGLVFSQTNSSSTPIAFADIQRLVVKTNFLSYMLLTSTAVIPFLKNNKDSFSQTFH